tara:strand:- start:978 stop:1538 length:561 start_codon:yes stop_codon:yes gene_type:complete
MGQKTSYKGKLLIAMPGMGDDRFSKSVIFLCSDDEEGAMGLVLNQTLESTESKMLLDHLDIDIDPKVNIQVHKGGPVERSRGFLLHSMDYMKGDTVPVVAGFCVTGTIDALRDAALGQGPENMIFALGYAGWTPGQLESELQQNSWLIADAKPETIFNTPHEKLWEAALSDMGIDPIMLSGTAGHA